MVEILCQECLQGAEVSSFDEVHAYEYLHDRTCRVDGEPPEITYDGDFDSIMGPNDIMVTRSLPEDERGLGHFRLVLIEI